MRVLVIGSGGREHAIIRKIAQSPLASAVYALPGNPGITEAVCLPGDPMDNAATVRAALEHRIDFCVVTPDDPLANGLVDALEEAGVRCFGPGRLAARIESSKVFAKDLMRRYGIPTASYAAFEELDQALAYAAEQPLPLVIKADGLAKGKGVVIAGTREEARQALHAMMAQGAYGPGGGRVVIEEFLTGPEVSVLTLTDGRTLVPLVSAMDHKRALDGDLGANTGGMGAVAPNPFYTGDIARQCMDSIFLPTIRAMAAEGCPFAGCLFFGLILTPEGPKVLEYNARFGDPETQAVLQLLSSDLLTALAACREGSLTTEHVRLEAGYACCLVLASGGYPGHFDTGFPLTWEEGNAQLHFAGVREAGGQLVTAGGRVVGVTAAGASLQEAVDACYHQAERVHFTGKAYRRDIGRKALMGKETPWYTVSL